jgi:DNA-binding transcriptional LysR family regulator
MIELRHLHYFIAVAEELNFRRAAERIHIDQTPLSRTVRDLEDQLGVQLFVRAPRKLHLTPAGLRLLQDARNIFIRIERTYRAVRETDARFRAPLRIGVADGIAQPKLSECMVRWREVAPEIPLELTEMRASELADALQREELDAGFSFGLPDDETLTQQPAWSYPVMALLPIGHELAGQSVLPIADVLAFPLLSCHAERQPGLLRQMQVIVHRYTSTPTLSGEAVRSPATSRALLRTWEWAWRMPATSRPCAAMTWWLYRYMRKSASPPLFCTSTSASACVQLCNVSLRMRKI